MKKWEYDIVRKATWDIDLDFETKRIAHLILERESKLVKEQMCLLESKESALAEQIEELSKQLCKVRSGIRRLEDKNDKLFYFKMNIKR